MEEILSKVLTGVDGTKWGKERALCRSHDTRTATRQITGRLQSTPERERGRCGARETLVPGPEAKESMGISEPCLETRLLPGSLPTTDRYRQYKDGLTT